MRFLGFLSRRFVHSIFVLWGLSIVIFVISRIMPGDPARMAVGARAPQWVVDDLRTQMRLDEPIYAQYFYWLRDALQGDFGISLVTRRPALSWEWAGFCWVPSQPATRTNGLTMSCASYPTLAW